MKRKIKKTMLNILGLGLIGLGLLGLILPIMPGLILILAGYLLLLENNLAVQRWHGRQKYFSRLPIAAFKKTGDKKIEA